MLSRGNKYAMQQPVATGGSRVAVLESGSRIWQQWRGAAAHVDSNDFGSVRGALGDSHVRALLKKYQE